MDNLEIDQMQNPELKSDPAQGIVSLEEAEEGIQILRLGSADEGVITLTEKRMEFLTAAIRKIKAEPPRGLVITGPTNEMFTAGADVNAIKDVNSAELGTQLARQGQLLFEEIAALPCTTVAAIGGPCVGGGYELALACNYRICSHSVNTRVGLPEIKLGIIPGFGGTQRLPRLIGLPKALDIILAGKTLFPIQAMRRGLVDELVPTEKLLGRAIAVARGEKLPKKAKIKFTDKLLTFTGLGRNIVKDRATQKLYKQTKGNYPAPPMALEVTISGLENGMEQGLEFEAQALGNMIVTPESKALVNLFFLTEGAKNIGKDARKAVEHTHAVVIGAGVMGAGIAGVLAKNGCNVILQDKDNEGVERGIAHVQRYLNKLRYLNESEKSFVLNRIERATKPSTNTGNANIVIEAVFEDLSVKQTVLSEIAEMLPEDAIIATNTSSISISDIASKLPKPERVVGMHFFNPVEKMPLVEIVRGKLRMTRQLL